MSTNCINCIKNKRTEPIAMKKLIKLVWVILLICISTVSFADVEYLGFHSPFWATQETTGSRGLSISGESNFLLIALSGRIEGGGNLLESCDISGSPCQFLGSIGEYARMELWYLFNYPKGAQTFNWQTTGVVERGLEPRVFMFGEVFTIGDVVEASGENIHIPNLVSRPIDMGVIVVADYNPTDLTENEQVLIESTVYNNSWFDAATKVNADQLVADTSPFGAGIGLILEGINWCVGDIDNDGDVDGQDLSSLITAMDLYGYEFPSDFSNHYGRTDCP